MPDLECSSCSFKFSQSKVPPRCPYCGRENTVRNARNAQDILDESFNDSRIMDEGKKRRNV